MTPDYGPWATPINAGMNPQLSSFWKRRLNMLVSTSQVSSTLSRRNLVWLGAATVLMIILPTFRSSPVEAEEDGRLVESKKATDPAAASSPGRDRVKSDDKKAESATVGKNSREPDLEQVLTTVRNGIEKNYGMVKTADVLVSVVMDTVNADGKHEITKMQQHVELSGQDIRLEQSDDDGVHLIAACRQNIWHWFTKSTNGGGSRLKISRLDALGAFMAFDPREYGAETNKEPLFAILTPKRVASATFVKDEKGKEIAKITTVQKIPQGAYAPPREYEYCIEYTFDSTVGFLPTIVQHTVNGNLSNRTEIEYQTVLSGKAFFPKRKLARYYDFEKNQSSAVDPWHQCLTLTIDRAVFNQPIAEDRFTKIDLPPGTIVDDQIDHRYHEIGKSIESKP